MVNQRFSLCVVVGVLFILFNIVNGQSYTANLVSGESNSGPLSGFSKNENFVGIVAGNTAIGGGQLSLKLNRNGCPSGCSNTSYAGAAWRHETSFGYGTTTISAKGTSQPGSVLMLTISDFSVKAAVRIALTGSSQTTATIDTFKGSQSSPTTVNLGFSHSQGFKTYKIVRSSGSLSCYANNVQIYSTNTVALIPSANLKIELSYEAHPSWWGPFIYSAESSAVINSITFAPITVLTPAPTSKATAAPTTAPTVAPTVKPTNAPTPAPTSAPTLAPTPAPTAAPGNGLLGGYFFTNYFFRMNATRLDATVDFDYKWNDGPSFPDFGGPADTIKIASWPFSVTWNGWVRPQYTEDYVFSIKSDDDYRVYINGDLVINHWIRTYDTYPPGQWEVFSNPISLVAGRKYTITIHWAKNGGYGSVALSWSSASLSKSIVPSSCLFPASSPSRPVIPQPPALTFAQKPSIPSNFNITDYMVTYSPVRREGEGFPDVVGAFRFVCNPSHLLYDDPVVYPGQPGISHLHQFFGNTLANGHSTYESLRTTGNSTCSNRLNRSAYWMPALLTSKNLSTAKVVVPDHIIIYYKRRPNVDPMCQLMGKGCITVPRGLRFVFGFDFADPAKGLQGGYFGCDGKSGNFGDIASAMEGCPGNGRLGVHLSTANCWDGVNLDSKDHRDHMAFSYVNKTTWMHTCPSTHPYSIPVFTIQAYYTADPSLDRTGKQSWLYSSDIYPNGTIGLAGSTFHADWFGAWDDTVLAQWEENCINGFRSCNDNDLGNGNIIQWFPEFKWTADPNRLPIPSRT